MNEELKLKWWNEKRSAITASAKAKAEAAGGVAKEQATPPAPADDAGTPGMKVSIETATLNGKQIATLPEMTEAIAKATEPMQAQIADLMTQLSAANKEIAALKEQQAQATAKAATDLTQAVEKAGTAASKAEAAAQRIDTLIAKAQTVADGISALAPRGGMRLPRIDERNDNKTAVSKEAEESPAAAKMREEREARRQAQPA